jgi:hypothetical protein
MAISLEKNGISRKVATGYSWKSLLFGILYPIARGDFKGFVFQLILALLSFGLAWLIIPFFYNNVFITRLIQDGWKPVDGKAFNYASKKLNYSPPIELAEI